MTVRRMLAAAVIAAAGAGTALADVTIEKILVTGEAAPDFDPLEGATIADLEAAGLSEGGHVAFNARIDVPGVGTKAVAYVGLPGALETFFRNGDPFPPLPGTFFAGPWFSPFPWTITTNSSGHVLATVTLSGEDVDSSNNGALLVWDGSEYTLAMRTGDPAPGFDPILGITLPNVTASSSSPGPRFFDDGRFMKQLSINFTETRFAGTPASPTLVLEPGAPVPGLPGELWWNAGAIECTRAGMCIYYAQTESTETMLWAGDVESPSPTLLLRESEPVPGMHPGNVPILGTSRSVLDINDAGEAIFNVRLTEGFGDATADNDTALLYGTAGNLVVLAREGDEVPGLPNVFFDEMYDEFPPTRVASGDDQIGLSVRVRGAGVTTANNYAILIGQPGALQVVFRSGDQAPGYPAGYTIGISDSNDPPMFNSAAGYAIRTDVLDDQGVVVGRALFVGDSVSGEPVLVAGAGIGIEVAPGDVRTVDSGSNDISHPGNLSSSNRKITFNAQNQLLFHTTFTDGTSGMFLATMPGVNDCAADLDGNGEVDVFDLLAYLDLWFSGDASAEFTEDDPVSIDVFDLLAYLDLWFLGC